MTIGQLNETIKGVAEFKIVRLSDLFPYNLPKPTGFAIDNGIEEKIQTTQNSQGELARASSYIKGRMPSLKVAFAHSQAEILQFKTGRVFETTTKTVEVLKSYRVTQNSFNPVITGFLGFGVTKDEIAQATITRNQLSFSLTQQPYDTFDPNVADSFAIGASLAVKFSNNLVAVAEIVSLITQETITSNGSISDDLVPVLGVRAILITTLNKVITFRADNLTISYAGSVIDTNADAIEVPLFFNDIPGTCFPYEWNYTSLTVGCNS